MSNLLFSQFEDYEILDHVSVNVPDGYGGTTSKYVYRAGADIKAYFPLDNSQEARIGMAQGAVDVYTGITAIDVILNYHAVVRRKSDGTVLRITSNGTDSKSPPEASVQIRKVTAERWEIPADELG